MQPTQASRTFLMRMFITFLLRTEPAQSCAHRARRERERGGWLVTVIELRSQLPFMGRDERVKPGSVREEGADAPWRSPPA
jgi:hypothetical protein